MKTCFRLAIVLLAFAAPGISAVHINPQPSFDGPLPLCPVSPYCVPDKTGAGPGTLQR
jgi:hypothetical protein